MLHNCGLCEIPGRGGAAPQRTARPYQPLQRTHPRVFGSVLTGTDDEDSDLDLLVDPTEHTSLLTLASPESA